VPVFFWLVERRVVHGARAAVPVAAEA
jgi:hypothetical protein